MANIEYAHPFKSMIEGQAAAQRAIQNAQAARQTNLDYRYNEWYQPLKQAEAQSNVGGELLKQAAAIAHHTHDYTNYNRILSHFLGVPAESLPTTAAGAKTTPQQMRDADIASGQLPVPFAYGNVYQAGGVGAYPNLPGKPEDPELHEAQRQAALRYWRGLGVTEAAGGPVSQLNPLDGVVDPSAPGAGPPGPGGVSAPVTNPYNAAPPIPMPEQTPVQQNPMAAPRIPGANAAAADASKALGAGDAAAAYGVPQAAKGPSIFDGEFKPEEFNFGSS